MHPNDSITGLDVFLQSIDSVRYAHGSMLEDYYDTINGYTDMIRNIIYLIKSYLKKHDDNDNDIENENDNDNDNHNDNDNDNDIESDNDNNNDNHNDNDNDNDIENDNDNDNDND